MSGFPGIKRELGESEADYRRRYDREKMRFYRAQKPKSDKKRGKGKGPAKNGNLTQEEWEMLQQRPDETDEEHGRRYMREAMRRSRAANPERSKQVRRDHYAANAEDMRSKARAKHAAHPELQREYDRRQREKNPEKYAANLAKLNEWGRENPEHLKAVKKAWNDNNRALMNAYSSNYRKDCRIQTVPWIDYAIVLRFHEEVRRLTLQTGIQHEVDHIVPLRGKIFQGLHVHTNMRIITASENCKKRAKVDFELIAFFDNLIIW